MGVRLPDVAAQVLGLGSDPFQSELGRGVRGGVEQFVGADTIGGFPSGQEHLGVVQLRPGHEQAWAPTPPRGARSGRAMGARQQRLRARRKAGALRLRAAVGNIGQSLLDTAGIAPGHP